MPQNNINVPKDNFVKFGSEQHKILFLSAEKIFAAFVDAPDCIFPFGEEQFQNYSSIFRGEIIYLQHGILHAHIPWRYSPVSKTFHADKIVVSSKFEIENFTETYHFPKEFLIPSGMPRYDLIPHKRYNGSKILYAPSWRAYMTEEEISNFIAKLSEFLNSAELSAFLSKYDLTLDFKPHPMFEKYSEMFDLRNSRVELAENVKAEEYLIFITDFSSYVFDFAYLSIPVVYFFPIMRISSAANISTESLIFLLKRLSENYAKIPAIQYQSLNISPKIIFYLKIIAKTEWKTSFCRSTAAANGCINIALTTKAISPQNVQGFQVLYFGFFHQELNLWI